MSEQNICIDSFAAAVPRKPRLPMTSATVFGKLLADFLAWRRRWKGVRALSHLDDRMLRDIGINRHDLPPAMQDALIASREQHELLDLYPHAVMARDGLRRSKICD